MTLTTRLLPLAMVVAWVFGLVVPCWTAARATGLPTGGMSVAAPTISSLTWLAGCAALFVAGVCSMSQPS
ncbi:hypothetical protein [Propioniferax innocua]|uniref:hypothetical protein n=1 Tax=Propioniferax innocua TaxID=1753 RepID=UPI001151463A|nr:hypothetical protein [Propioniferax innocua]